MHRIIPNEKYKLFLFFIYTVFFETLVWGLTVGAIVYLHWSWIIIFFGMLMSGAQLKPKHFGLKYEIEKEECEN